MNWIVGRLFRLFAILAVLAAICVGVGFLLTWARGGSAMRSVTLVFYVGGALAVVGALLPRGPLAPSAYGDTLATDAVKASNPDRAANRAVGVGLLVIGGVLDTFS